MALLGVSNLTKAFGTDLLFEGVSFEVQANDKIGVVGVNGSGKTTLFKMITGEMRPRRRGAVSKQAGRSGYMEQHVCKNLEETALDEVLTVFTPLMKMEEEIELLDGASCDLIWTGCATASSPRCSSAPPSPTSAWSPSWRNFCA